MERIFLSRLIIGITIFGLVQSVVGQDSYYVFKKAGSPQFHPNKKVERGAYFQASDAMLLKKKDTVTLVDQKGILYQLHQPRKYGFKDIRNHKFEMEYTSFTLKYLSHVWKQFTGQRKSKQQAGVVYREERDVRMLLPVDSAKVYQSNIWFRWNNKTDSTLVYFFLKDLKSGHLTKVGTPADSLLLHLDNKLLRAGNSYEWAVATESFPPLTSLRFRRLNILKKEDYLKLKDEVAALFITFKILGFKETEIKDALCKDYKFCSF